MRVALENEVDRLSILSNLKPKRGLIDAGLRILLGGKPPRYPLYLTAAAQRQFAQETLGAIHELKPDAMLAISSHCLVRMGVPPLPTFMVTDAPWLSWKETYKEFDTMPLLGPRFARLEADAAKRLAGIIVSSDWAAEEARRLYGMSAAKVHSIPLGAVWTPDLEGQALDAIIDARPDDQLELLYVGKDWERKGGPLAIEIARLLKESGVPNVRLHIAGCTPDVRGQPPGLVQVHGFLNPEVPSESALLKSLFLRSHFLVVPTQAECFGIVFAEAQAFALPPVSRAVQALPSIVIDGETGILEHPEAPASAYSQRILALARDRPRYRLMARAARARFEATFTWERFAVKTVETIVDAL